MATKRALADRQAEQVAQDIAQARQRDGLDGAQVDDEGAQVRAEGRARLQPRRRRCLEAPGAARADAAVQRDPRHVGLDLRDLDAVVDLAGLLRDTGDVGAAALAAAREDVALRRRVGMQRPMRAGVRPALGLGRRRLGWLLPRRRRQAGIVRRLRRQAEPALELGDPRHQDLDPRHQRGDQAILVEIGRWRHPQVDSYSPKRRNPYPRLPINQSCSLRTA